MSISDLDPNVPGSNAPAGEGDDHLRAINSALNEAFGAVDGPITNTGASGGVADTDPPDAATWSQLFEDVRALASGAAAGGSIQLGMCMVWNTANGAIPTGWTLCNGVNINNVAVPNLVDRFIMGAGNLYNNGEVGGSAPGSSTTGSAGDHSHTTSGHVLTVGELPATLGSNIYIEQAASTQADSHEDAGSFARGSATPNAATTLPVTVTGANSDAHTHGNTNSTGAHTHTIDENSYPPFQALTWICYVGTAP